MVQGWFHNCPADKASERINSLGFEFETIYDQSDSLEIVIVEKKTGALYALYKIDSINEIAELEKYKLRKCYLAKCPIIL